jgi:hypothetical protein
MSVVIDNIDQAILEPTLLGAAFGGDVASWSTWRAVLKAAWGIELSRHEAKAFAAVAGSRKPPQQRVRELWAVVRRRGGKSRIAALIVCYVALFVQHRLAPGERGLCLVLSATLEQSKVALSYCQAFLERSTVLRQEIEDVTANEIRLKNGITIATHPNSFRSVRGRTLLCCVFDEISFWRDDTSATPDSEVYSAVLPSLATCNGLLVGISSPYRKAGLLHAKHKQYFGADGDDVLVVQGSSKMFNITLSDAVIEAQKAADPTASDSEWGGLFRADLVGLFDDNVIDLAAVRGRPLELPPLPSKYSYRCGVDPSGGAIGGDAYSITIGHREGERFVVDLCRGRRGPFDPAEVTGEYAGLCHDYHITAVTGDAYGREWVTAAWRKEGVSYANSDLNASMIYLEALPLFMRGLVELPADHLALLRELRLLERIPGRVGKDQVVHPRNAHDDLANSVCLCLRQLAVRASFFGPDATWIDGADTDSDAAKSKAELDADSNYRWRRDQYFRQVFGRGGRSRMIDWSRMP